MKQGAGKQKGSSFERKICKELSLWITDGERDDLFWRSSNSGGRATIVAVDGTKHTQSGDISSIHPLGHTFTETFVIECKHYKSIQLDTFVFTGKGHFEKFWKQVRRDAKKFNKHPMLITKQNNRPILIALNGKGSSLFQWGPDDSLDRDPSGSLIAWFPDFDMFLYDFESFLQEYGTVNIGTWKPPKPKRKKRKL
jgi:hypothetical protein